MKTTVIYAHPGNGSFNYAILEKVETILNEKNEPYYLIDLYKDNFNPVYSEAELKQFPLEQPLDPLVVRYQEQLKDTKVLIIIFPIWWGNMPGMLKGFFDKVMVTNFSHINMKRGIKGKLTHIEKAVIITTSKTPSFFLQYCGGSAIKKGLIKLILKAIGISKSKWINMGQINYASEEKRKYFLDHSIYW